MANRKSAPRRVSTAKSQTRGASAAASTRASSSSSLSLRGLNIANAQRMLGRWSREPSVRYAGGAIVGGLAIYGVARLVRAIISNREEITEFVSENLDMVEGKLKQFKADYRGETVDAH